MKNIIVVIILVAIISMAVLYILKQKKKEIGCIGCPANTKCPNKGKNCCSDK
ncbi:MAG: FeoB-associated Cys-rich membrane protein [Clostridia bacterium]|nr:FeoB-associated Cys-rich membrane protein [Clostridia bacterium]